MANLALLQHCSNKYRTFVCVGVQLPLTNVSDALRYTLKHRPDGSASVGLKLYKVDIISACFRLYACLVYKRKDGLCTSRVHSHTGTSFCASCGSPKGDIMCTKMFLDNE